MPDANKMRVFEVGFLVHYDSETAQEGHLVFRVNDKQLLEVTKALIVSDVQDRIEQLVKQSNTLEKLRDKPKQRKETLDTHIDLNKSAIKALKGLIDEVHAVTVFEAISNITISDSISKHDEDMVNLLLATERLVHINPPIKES